MRDTQQAVVQLTDWKTASLAAIHSTHLFKLISSVSLRSVQRDVVPSEVALKSVGNHVIAPDLFNQRLVDWRSQEQSRDCFPACDTQLGMLNCIEPMSLCWLLIECTSVDLDFA